MLPKTLFKSVFLGLAFLFCLFGCTETNVSGTALIYKNWIYTHNQGTITVHGNPIGASESWNSSGNISVNFEQSGKFNFKLPPQVNETDGITYSDSVLMLTSDSSYFANFCAYPVINFVTTPELPTITLKHVSDILQIVFIRGDSLLLRSQQVRTGNNAPDTLYTEYTGFKKG